ncbi:MAG: S9 family peptidase, partial [Alphaproteobacteria bacterium]
MKEETTTIAGGEDPFLWLEEVEGERALAWAREQNERALARLETDPRFAAIRDAALAVYTAADRIPYGEIRNGNVDNFWQDKDHVRGLWRRATLASYASESPDWRTLLDLDALAAAEGENWVWKGADCLPPAFDRCVLRLSRGGADAVVLREFDTQSGQFVGGGFALGEEKQNVAWLDADRLLIASPLEGGSKNTSGYARTIRLWQRGTPLADAQQVFESAETDAFVFPAVFHRPEGREAFIVRAPDFFHQTVYHMGAGGALSALPLPDDVDFRGVIDGQLIALLRSDWAVDGFSAPAGAVVSVPLASLDAGKVDGAAIIAAPSETLAIQDVARTADAVYVTALDNVTGRLMRATRDGDGWRTRDITLPPNGTVSLVSADELSDTLFFNFESFLDPDTLYLARDGGDPEPVKHMPARFDAADYTVEQQFATSADGTRVPYFLIRAKEMAFDGSTPTILYGYGGFEISLSPSYLSPLAIEWLKRGGAYAVANIRGGGEFGPRWHKAALKENRPRAYEDFAAVAEDLVARQVTSARRLGIYGGSNGGLLVGATMVRYPQLCGAVVSSVPLLDMLLYHKLLDGESWIGEYG